MSPLRPLVILALVLPLASVSGQSTWSSPTHTTALGLRLSKGFYGTNGPSFATLSVMPSARIVLSPTAAVELEMPFALASLDASSGSGTTSGSRFGNPLIGVDVSAGPQVRFRGSLRLGVTSDPSDDGAWAALAYGMMSEFDRFEAFIPETHALRAGVEFGAIPAVGKFVQGRLGGTYMIPKGDGDNELMAEYGVRVGYHTGTILVHGGLLGRGILTGEGGSFADRTTHQLAVGAQSTRGRVRPEAELHYFLDDMAGDLKVVASLGLSITP